MRQIAFLLVIGVLLASCGKNNQYTVSGTIDGVGDGTALLQKVGKTGAETIDSVQIADGKFQFTGSVENPELFLILINDNRMPVALFLEPGDISISGNIENLNDAVVEGGELNKILKSFNDSIPSMDRAQGLQQEFMEARQAGDQEKMQALAAEYQSIMMAQQEYYHNFVRENSDNPVGAFLALNMARSLDMEELEELVTSFEKSIPGHPYVEELKEMLEPMKKQKAAEDAIQIGKEAPDFTLTDMDGNEVSLKDFNGKYVLLDFWASWCRPCRDEMPNVAKAYQQFAGEEFEVIGVSLDKTKEPWLKAVEEDNINWVQLHDPEGDVANTYGVQSIPFTLLLDKDGVIIEKNLRGDALQEKLDEIL
ncbi:redoxin domain-containing protein [Thermophagus sp. OGC60D27]|uniref:redoxin domain-containing protein n=1 Tax=Thermophagus sp. OGC60D27 TaxID=3458415 RepID=UPI0040380EBB